MIRKLRIPSGYFLAETIVSLALVAFLASVGIPIGIQSVRWIFLRSSVQEFSRELQRARLQAITENSAIRIVVYQSEKQYILASADDSTILRGALHTLASGITFHTLPSRAVVFHPWGTASPAGSYIIRGAAGQYRVLVHLTGRMRIEEVSP